MKQIKGIALTEKGALKNAVRKGIVDKVSTMVEPELEKLGFEAYEDNNAMALAYQDMKGNMVYATLTLTVGIKAPDEKAKKKSGSKKKSVAEIIEID